MWWVIAYVSGKYHNYIMCVNVHTCYAFLVSVSVNGNYALVVHIYIWRNLNGKSGKTLPAVGVPWLQGSSTVQEKGPTIFTSSGT